MVMARRTVIATITGIRTPMADVFRTYNMSVIPSPEPGSTRDCACRSSGISCSVALQTSGSPHESGMTLEKAVAVGALG